jgi:predicted CopG family antitoxin
VSHRVNIMVDDQVWQSLQKMPKGERSQFINLAIKERLSEMKRRIAAKKMDERRVQLKPIDESVDVLELLRQDRMRDA